MNAMKMLTITIWNGCNILAVITKQTRIETIDRRERCNICTITLVLSSLNPDLSFSATIDTSGNSCTLHQPLTTSSLLPQALSPPEPARPEVSLKTPSPGPRRRTIHRLSPARRCQGRTANLHERVPVVDGGPAADKLVLMAGGRAAVLASVWWPADRPLMGYRTVLDGLP